MIHFVDYNLFNDFSSKDYLLDSFQLNKKRTSQFFFQVCIHPKPAIKVIIRPRGVFLLTSISVASG